MYSTSSATKIVEYDEHGQDAPATEFSLATSALSALSAVAFDLNVHARDILRVMCGFAGVIVWDEKYRVMPETLKRMSVAVAHRGPDGEGLRLTREHEPITPDQPQVALAFRRLAILDPDERSMQPFTDGRHWLVFNGEIYNFRELRAELTVLMPDYQWRTTGDTEVLLAAYAAWGDKCVEKLNGMFAFAVWDEVEEKLFFARDRMGQKPLYVSLLIEDGEPLSIHAEQNYAPVAIAFASESTALRAIPWVDQGFNPSSLAQYLIVGYTADGSLARGIQQVRPASWFKIESLRNRRLIGRAYSKLSRDEQALPDADSVTTTRTLVEQAVSRQLVFGRANRMFPIRRD